MMFHGFRLPLSPAGACAEDLQKDGGARTLRKTQNPQVLNLHLGHPGKCKWVMRNSSPLISFSEDLGDALAKDEIRHYEEQRDTKVRPSEPIAW